MALTESEFAFLYALYRAKERGEYMPLSLLIHEARLSEEDTSVVALSVENKGLVEVVVDDRLLGKARYKYKLTPQGFAAMQEILRVPAKKVGGK